LNIQSIDKKDAMYTYEYLRSKIRFNFIENKLNQRNMKKLLLFSLVICFLYGNPANAQVGGLLKKVKKSVTNDSLGVPEENKSKPGPEPSCACDPAQLVMDLGGKYKIDYTEVDISVLDDGKVLVKDRVGGAYYILKDGVTQGPYKQGDSQVDEFGVVKKDDNSTESFLLKNKDYISRSGERYMITFNGKNYGPYDLINEFVVNKSKDKFAALVTENVMMKEDQAKKMEAAMNNAKTDQERADLAMQFNQQLANKMMQGGGVNNILPTLVTNIPGVTYDPRSGGLNQSQLSGDVKYDDILAVNTSYIINLQGKKLFTLPLESQNREGLFVNSTNTKYAYFNYGTLTFSDNTKLSELFGPDLVKVDGKIYLAYMYYSPKRNAIMQCKIPF
jgi:hypothetical protein